MRGYAARRARAHAMRALSAALILCVGGTAATEPPDLAPDDLKYETPFNARDVEVIVAARNQPADPDDARDLDGDGVITLLDARIYAQECSLCTHNELACDHGDRGYCKTSEHDFVECGNTDFGFECGLLLRTFKSVYPLLPDAPYQIDDCANPPCQPVLTCTNELNCPSEVLENIFEGKGTEIYDPNNLWSIDFGTRDCQTWGNDPLGLADTCYTGYRVPVFKEPDCTTFGSTRAERDAQCQSIFDDWYAENGNDTLRHPDYTCAQVFFCDTNLLRPWCRWETNQEADQACCGATTSCLTCDKIQGCVPGANFNLEFQCTNDAVFAVPCDDPFIHPVADEYPPPMIDEDFDGVYDHVDLCPGTAPGEPVDAFGCSAAQSG